MDVEYCFSKQFLYLFNFVKLRQKNVRVSENRLQFVLFSQSSVSSEMICSFCK